MKYPIDIQAAIIVMEPGKARELCAVAFQLVNICYQDGRNGKPFMWNDLDTELDMFRKALGKQPEYYHVRLINATIDFCRDAYQQGKADRQ